MKARSLILVGFLLASLEAPAQQSRELLSPVNQGQSRRLEEYNYAFLQETLYSAARSRIVSVNSELLLQDEAVTITPFSDVEPIVVTPERVVRRENSVSWRARMQVDPRFESLGEKYYTFILVQWWDLDVRGNASLSASNRFRFSPAWVIGEDGVPTVRAPAQGGSETIGPPPRTPREIAEHKRLSRLDRIAFGSLSAKLTLPTGQTYVVTPLRFTPKYSVVYEVDENRIVPIPFEPEDIDSLTDEQRMRIEQYRAFVQSLPLENDKAVRGDIE